MERIGVRELRQHASKWLAKVRAGATIEITDRGDPVARLVPLGPVDPARSELIDRRLLKPAPGPRLRLDTRDLIQGSVLTPILDDQRSER